MVRTVEVIGMVFVILIIASCICVDDISTQNSITHDKNSIYGNCANALHNHGMNSADMKTLIQECVANSLDKKEVKENV